MFVYKKNTLERKVEALTSEIAIGKLHHKPTGVTLTYEFRVDPNAKPLMQSADDIEHNIVSPYFIYKLDANGKYDFKEEVWDTKKSLLDNFKDAIDVFEKKIFEELDEEEPQPQTFSQLPQVGDLIRIGQDRFGVVTASDEITRDIEFEEKTQQEMNQLIADIKDGSIDSLVESIFGQIKM